MAKDRRVRFQTAAQLAEALEPFIDPGKAKLMPQPAATYAAYEAWRQSQPIVPQGMAVSASEPVSEMATVSANEEPDQSAASVPRIGAMEAQAGFTLANASGYDVRAADREAMTSDAFVQPVAPGVRARRLPRCNVGGGSSR